MKEEKKRESYVVSHEQGVTVGLITALLVIRNVLVCLSGVHRDGALIFRQQQQTCRSVSAREGEEVKLIIEPKGQVLF